MYNLVMDIIQAFGFQLIPGFLALFLLLLTGFIHTGTETVTAGYCRRPGIGFALIATLEPVKKQRRNRNG